MFGNARYMNGTATNPDFGVVIRAAVQIKNAIDATIELGGSNYVLIDTGYDADYPQWRSRQRRHKL